MLNLEVFGALTTMSTTLESDAFGISTSGAGAITNTFTGVLFFFAFVAGFFVDHWKSVHFLLSFTAAVVGVSSFGLFLSKVLSGTSVVVLWWLWLPIFFSASGFFKGLLASACSGSSSNCEGPGSFSLYYLTCQLGPFVGSIVFSLAGSTSLIAIVFLLSAIVFVASFLLFFISATERISVSRGASVKETVSEFFSFVWAGVSVCCRKAPGGSQTVITSCECRSPRTNVPSASLAVVLLFFALCMFNCAFSQMYSLWVGQAKMLNLCLDGQENTMSCFRVPPEIFIALNPLLEALILPFYDIFSRRMQLGTRISLATGFVFACGSCACAFALQWRVDRSPPSSQSVYLMIPQLTLISFSDVVLTVECVNFLLKVVDGSLKGRSICFVIYFSNFVGNLLVAIILLLPLSTFVMQGLIFALLFVTGTVCCTLLQEKRNFDSNTAGDDDEWRKDHA